MRRMGTNNGLCTLFVSTSRPAPAGWGNPIKVTLLGIDWGWHKTTMMSGATPVEPEADDSKPQTIIERRGENERANKNDPHLEGGKRNLVGGVER